MKGIPQVPIRVEMLGNASDFLKTSVVLTKLIWNIPDNTQNQIAVIRIFAFYCYNARFCSIANTDLDECKFSDNAFNFDAWLEIKQMYSSFYPECCAVVVIICASDIKKSESKSFNSSHWKAGSRIEEQIH